MSVLCPSKLEYLWSCVAFADCRRRLYCVFPKMRAPGLELCSLQPALGVSSVFCVWVWGESVSSALTAGFDFTVVFDNIGAMFSVVRFFLQLNSFASF